MSQYFVYTRTNEVDYRIVISPTEDYCPKDIRREFLKEIRGVIDVETYDDPLTSPRWLFSKKSGIILFGVGVMNEMLSHDCTKDYTGRPVRGFIGIVVKSEDNPVLLPIDLDFYKQAYSELIEPIWMLNRDECKQSSVVVDYSQTNSRIVDNSESEISLNTDFTKCRILGDVIPELAFQKALNSKNDISVVTGFSSKSHAYAMESEYKYLNAIVTGILVKEERTISSNADDLEDKRQPIIPTPPKKANRLKLIIGVLILMSIILLILGKCSRNMMQKPHNISISGDTVHQQQMNDIKR